MPSDRLHRCVQHVMGQGHSESSAYGICRSSLGLADDGSEDGKRVDMTDKEIEMAANNELARKHYESGPSFEKKMVVCTPFGDYINGEDEGEMTPARLQAIARKFKKYRRNVPIYTLGDHVEDLDERIPSGWVEELEYSDSHPGYPDGALLATVKLIGDAAELVGGDFIRGASIGTVQGVNPDDTPQGEVLQHLLLTNSGFDKTLNIAAARVPGGERVASYFTAFEKKEVAMATEEAINACVNGKLEDESFTPDEGETREETARKQCEKELADPPADPPEADEVVETDAKAELEATQALLKTAVREKAALRAANDNLTADVKRFQKNPALNLAVTKIKGMERQILAQKVRQLVARGVNAGQFNIAQVDEPEIGWDNPSDEVVLAWFKTSMFKNKIDLLTFALATYDKRRVNQQFRSGVPKQGATTFTSEERKDIRKLGQDPEAVLAAMNAGNFAEYKEAMAKK